MAVLLKGSTGRPDFGLADAVILALYEIFVFVEAICPSVVSF
jgi:hypothetical protein